MIQAGQPGLAAAEGCLWRFWYRLALGFRASPTSPQLQLQALLSARHRPMMVGPKNRPEHWGPDSQQRLVRCNPPVVCDVHELAVLCESPDAGAFEVTVGDELEPVGRVGFSDFEAPPQRVRQPAFGVQLDHAPDATLRVAGRELFYIEVDRRPPPRQLERVAQDVRDLARRAADTPAGEERVLGSQSVLQVVR